MPRCFMAKKLKYPYQQWKASQEEPEPGTPVQSPDSVHSDQTEKSFPGSFWWLRLHGLAQECTESLWIRNTQGPRSARPTWIARKWTGTKNREKCDCNGNLHSHVLIRHGGRRHFHIFIIQSSSDLLIFWSSDPSSFSAFTGQLMFSLASTFYLSN